MGHAGAANGLNESFLDDAVLDIQGQLAGTLLRCAPAYTMGEAADVLHVLGLDPLALLRNRSGAVVHFLCHTCHVFHFL